MLTVHRHVSNVPRAEVTPIRNVAKRRLLCMVADSRAWRLQNQCGATRTMWMSLTLANTMKSGVEVRNWSMIFPSVGEKSLPNSGWDSLLHSFAAARSNSTRNHARVFSRESCLRHRWRHDQLVPFWTQIRPRLNRSCWDTI